jgi:hypothetical protein
MHASAGPESHRATCERLALIEQTKALVGPPARYVDCENSGCFVRVPADGANVRRHPNGQAFLALVNGTPLVVLQWQERWALVAAACNLVPTGLWSDTQGVPLDTCHR